MDKRENATNPKYRDLLWDVDKRSERSGGAVQPAVQSRAQMAFKNMQQGA
jgi:hypothetical protein